MNLHPTCELDIIISRCVRVIISFYFLLQAGPDEPVFNSTVIVKVPGELNISKTEDMIVFFILKLSDWVRNYMLLLLTKKYIKYFLNTFIT